MASSHIFYIDPSSNVTLCFDGKHFSQTEISKKQFIASRVFYDDIISHSFKVAKSTSPEEIKSSIEIRMYEDAGLDLQKEYKITHILKELDFEEMVLVEAFAIEKSKVEDRLKAILKKTKYIDFLAIPFLSFSTLYKNKIIAAKNDVFVYMEENEAFLALYKDGKYLSTKSLTNFENILHSLHKETIDMDMATLQDILKNKGLDPNAYDRDDAHIFNALETIFADIFTKMNNVIIHNRSIFGFEKIDRLFFGTKFGRIKGLQETSKNFFSSELELMDFNLFSEKVESNFFERILASYIYDVSQELLLEQDITFFKREAPFVKTEAGKFLLFACGFLCLLALYPLYLNFEIDSLEKESLHVRKELDVIKAGTQKVREEITSERKALSLSQEELDMQTKRVENISKSIQNLYNTKIANKTVSDFFYKVNVLLQKYQLSTKSITLKNINHMEIEVFSSLDKRDTIAKFMKDLISHGFVEVNTKEIKLEDGSYLSIVEIAR